MTLNQTQPVDSSGKLRSGFTLVELLVTITIVIVLAAVVFTASGKIRKSALQAKAIDPLRQVATACIGFSTENNGDINTVVFEGAPRLSGQWVRRSFWGALTPHIFADVTLADNGASARKLRQQLSAFFDTPDPKFMKGTFQGDGTGAIADTCANVPFAFNANVSGWRKYMKMSQYSDPSKTLYFAYGRGTFSKKDGDIYAPLPETNAERRTNIDWFSNKTAPFIFLDGHMEILNPPLPERFYSVKPPET